jgi:hypothetical protein
MSCAKSKSHFYTSIHGSLWSLHYSLSPSSCVVAINCFQHAADLIRAYNVCLDDEGTAAMVSFQKLLRKLTILVNEFTSTSSKSFSPLLSVSTLTTNSSSRFEIECSRDMVIREAELVIDLAHKEKMAGLFEEAARQYHTASIYLRMAGPLTADLTAKLLMASKESKRCGSFLGNSIEENLNGKYIL